MLAPAGTQLPLTAKLKANSRIRYEWDANSRLKANVQAVASFEGKRRRDLRTIENAIYGNLRAYTQVDLSAGLEQGPWSLDLFMKNVFDTRGQIAKSIQCNELICGDAGRATAIGPKIYTTVTTPRMLGLRIGRKF